MRIVGLSRPRAMGRATLEWLEARWRSGSVSPETWLRHEGGSMAPALRAGDRLLVAPLAGAAPPRPGEIVVTRRGEKLVAHRLIAMEGDIAITRGDASPRSDRPLHRGRLLARVVRIERPAGIARSCISWISHLIRSRRQ